MFGLKPDDVTLEICTVRLMDDLDVQVYNKSWNQKGREQVFTKIKNGKRILANIPTDYMMERLRKHMKRANI